MTMDLFLDKNVKLCHPKIELFGHFHVSIKNNYSYIFDYLCIFIVVNHKWKQGKEISRQQVQKRTTAPLLSMPSYPQPKYVGNSINVKKTLNEISFDFWQPSSAWNIFISKNVGNSIKREKNMKWDFFIFDKNIPTPLFFYKYVGNSNC